MKKPPKLAEERKLESLIKFAKFPCNENSLFYHQALGEINRKKQHVLQHFKI